MPDANQKPYSHRRTVTLSVLGSVLSMCFLVLPTFAVVLRPWVISVMAAAMSGEISAQAQAQTAPLAAGFKVIIEGNIAQLEEEITQLQWRMQNRPSSWTEVDAQLLLTKTRRLASQRAALQEITRPVQLVRQP